MPKLLEHYDLLLSLALQGLPRRAARLAAQQRAILALDGLQPDVGHEVLWVVREVLSSESLCARRLLSSAAAELQALLEAVAGAHCRAVAGGRGDRGVGAAGGDSAGQCRSGRRRRRDCTLPGLPGAPPPIRSHRRRCARPVPMSSRSAVATGRGCSTATASPGWRTPTMLSTGLRPRALPRAPRGWHGHR